MPEASRQIVVLKYASIINAMDSAILPFSLIGTCKKWLLM